MTTDYSDPSLCIPDFPMLDSGGEAACTQVHTQETSEHLPPSSGYRSFMISGITKKVAAARRVYETCGLGDPANRIKAFDGCRSVAWFVRHRVSGKIRVAASRCGLRWCPLCIKSRRYVITGAIAKWMANVKQPKFMTLTLKHSEAPLSDQVDALYGYFKELKRRPWFKKRVFGGVWFFQIKKSSKDGLWHPHLHCLIQGRYLPHDELSRVWSKVTHGSKIVDIRAVNDRTKAIEYVARYASSPCDISTLEHDDAVTVVTSLHNRRICGSWGLAKSIKLAPTTPEDIEDWQRIGSYSEILKGCGCGGYFDDIVKAWKTGESWEMPDFWVPPPKVEVKEPETVEVLTYKQLLLF